MEFSIQYHVTINSQLNDQNSIRYYIIWYGMVWYASMGMVFHDVVYVAMVCRSVNDLLAVTKESTFFSFIEFNQTFFVV